MTLFFQIYTFIHSPETGDGHTIQLPFRENAEDADQSVHPSSHWLVCLENLRLEAIPEMVKILEHPFQRYQVPGTEVVPSATLDIGHALDCVRSNPCQIPRRA